MMDMKLKIKTLNVPLSPYEHLPSHTHALILFAIINMKLHCHDIPFMKESHRLASLDRRCMYGHELNFDTLSRAIGHIPSDIFIK